MVGMHRKELHNVICSNMDGLRDYPSKWSKSNANIIWYHLYVEYKKRYKWIYNTEIDFQT